MTERNQMKKLLNGLVLTVLLASAVAAFTGCRTAHGFGEDMENAGHEIQKGTD
jgi:predicted small secreted protein